MLRCPRGCPGAAQDFKRYFSKEENLAVLDEAVRPYYTPPAAGTKDAKKQLEDKITLLGVRRRTSLCAVLLVLPRLLEQAARCSGCEVRITGLSRARWLLTMSCVNFLSRQTQLMKGNYIRRAERVIKVRSKGVPTSQALSIFLCLIRGLVRPLCSRRLPLQRWGAEAHPSHMPVPASHPRPPSRQVP